MSRKDEIGPNSQCYCGSGKKYKKCCGALGRRNDYILRKATPQEHARMQELYRQQREREQVRRKRFGEINPIVQCEWSAQGKNVVAVGNVLCIGDFNTFPEFLRLYFREVFTKEWMLEEAKRPADEQHPILLWFGHFAIQEAYQDSMNREGRWVRPSGSSMCFLTLAYDLYILRNHGHVQDILIDRMKHHDFQAARYELFVAASLIRAGFSIEFEDETDNLRKHPEFTATDTKTGTRIAVEAKSKHRHGVLGFTKEQPSSHEFRLHVDGLIRKALKKKPGLPFVIFVDMNMPPQTGDLVGRNWIEELGNAVALFDAREGDRDAYTALLFTNTPQHYGMSLQDAPMADCIPLLATRPQHPLTDVSLISRLHEGVKKYGAIPYDFEEGS